MGCTGSRPLPPCEYPAYGFNYRGIEESIDRNTGNFLMKCHTNCSWKWFPSPPDNPSFVKEKVFYTFPVLADRIAGISISFSLQAKGFAFHEPILIQLELLKNDEKTVLTSLLATATEITKQDHQLTVKENNPILQRAKKGDIYRLKCSNIVRSATIHISNLSSIITSCNSYSCVRLPFEEYLETPKVLHLRSDRIWELRALRAPIGWTNTPVLSAKPTMMDGIIEIEIIDLNTIHSENGGGGGGGAEGGEGSGNLSANTNNSPSGKFGSKNNSPFNSNNNSSKKHNSPQTFPPPPPPSGSPGKKKKKVTYDNEIDSSSPPAKNTTSAAVPTTKRPSASSSSSSSNSLGKIEFSLNLIRGSSIILSYVIIDQQRLHLGKNSIKFQINEKLSSPLIKSFRIGDYYQINRYHQSDKIILRITKFHLRFITKEKRSICQSPHRLIRLTATAGSVGQVGGGGGHELVTKESDFDVLPTDVDHSHHNNQQSSGEVHRPLDDPVYDSFYYFTPEFPKEKMTSTKNGFVVDDYEDPHELHQEIHRGLLRTNRNQSGWGSWMEEEEDG